MITRILTLPATAFLSLLVGASAIASDLGFESCDEALHQSTKVIPGETWQRGTLPARILSYLSTLKGGLMDDAIVLQWGDRTNPNGSITFIVNMDYPHQEMSDWLLLVDDGHNINLKEFVYADAFAFSKHSSEGVYGLYFCGKDGISHEWVWAGADWKIER
jgi:hypothetical protein